MAPKLSVITVCKNASVALERTIQSVATQSGSNLEHIVIDGASNDATENVLSTYARCLSVAISEPDRGIYDAMNKGLARGSGELILFLNAGDTFCSVDVASRVLSVYEATRPDFLYGDVQVLTNTPSAQVRRASYSGWDLTLFLDSAMCHQGVFASRRAFDLCGSFDTSYKIAADLDWMLRALRKHRLPSQYLPFLTCCFDGGGISSSQANQSILRLEMSRAIEHNFTRAELLTYRLARRLNLRGRPALWSVLKTAFNWGLNEVPFATGCQSALGKDQHQDVRTNAV